MSIVSLDYARMNSAAARLDAKQQAIATQLAKIKSISDAIVGSDFKTVKASPAFGQLVTDTVQDLGKAIAALTTYAEVLRSAAKAYRETDEALAQQLGGGGATSTLKIDMTEIAGLKDNLAATQAAFKDVHKDAAALDAGVLGHGGLADAVHDFAHNWDKRRKEIVNNVDDIHEAVTNIDTNFTEADKDLAANLKSGG